MTIWEKDLTNYLTDEAFYVHQMIKNTVADFCVDWKSKMATTSV
jgi:hypothetical protein